MHPLIDRLRQGAARRGGYLPLIRAILRFVREEGVSALVRRLCARGPGAAMPPPPAAPHSPPPPQPRARRAPQGEPGVLLLGHPYLISGRGEDIRTAVHALDLAGVPFHIRNVFGAGAELRSKLPEFGYFERVQPDHPYRANLFFLNADEMAAARSHLGEALFARGYNIGYWAWELSRFPDPWLGALDLVDEVWAPSRFIQQAVAERARCPVVRMPLAVEPRAAALPRERFGLPPEKFLFLFFFDFSSFVARKNPWAIIEAFTATFPEAERERVGLVIKLNGGRLRPQDYEAFLQHESIRRKGITLVDEVLSDSEIHALMCCCDAFVSLHRSEGFGRGPAEAMYFGKPVIVTGYSGNLDFCHDQNACLVDYSLVAVREGEYPQGENQIWAEADVEQAAWFMRRLVDDPAFARRIGAAGAAYVREFNSYAAVGRRYARRLRQLDLI